MNELIKFLTQLWTFGCHTLLTAQGSRMSSRTRVTGMYWKFILHIDEIDSGYIYGHMK